MNIYNNYFISFCIEQNTDSYINHTLSSFVLLVPPIVLHLIARTISGLVYNHE